MAVSAWTFNSNFNSSELLTVKRLLLCTVIRKFSDKCLVKLSNFLLRQLQMVIFNIWPIEGGYLQMNVPGVQHPMQKLWQNIEYILGLSARACWITSGHIAQVCPINRHRGNQFASLNFKNGLKFQQAACYFLNYRKLLAEVQGFKKSTICRSKKLHVIKKYTVCYLCASQNYIQLKILHAVKSVVISVKTWMAFEAMLVAGTRSPAFSFTRSSFVCKQQGSSGLVLRFYSMLLVTDLMITS